MNAKFALWLGFLLLLTPCPAWATDWPQWLGPRGDNIADDDGFDMDLAHWRILWKAKVGLGNSAVSVAEGRAFVLGNDGKSQQTVYCFDAASGQLDWKYSYAAQIIPGLHPGGPVAPVTVIGNKVVTLSRDGQIFCFSVGNGNILWQTNLLQILGINLPPLGIASSPFAQNGQVIFSAGAVAALDMTTGRVLWTGPPTNPPAYTTPVAFFHEGREFVAALDSQGLSILDAQGGGTIARAPFYSGTDITATTPLVFDNGSHIFVSGTTNSQLLAFNGTALAVVWDSPKIKNVLDDNVVIGNVIYGIAGRQDTAATRLVSVDITDGTLYWANNSFGYVTIIGIGGDLLALTQAGQLVTSQPSPYAYSPYSHAPVIAANCWTIPVYAGGQIYVRNDQGDVVCFGR